MKKNMEKIMKLLTDNYVIKILVASYQNEKNAIQMSQELDIPIAACYRRLSALRSLGFVDMHEKITNRGKKIAYYRSKIKKATIKIEDNRIIIDIILRNQKVEKYVGKIVKGYAQ